MYTLLKLIYQLDTGIKPNKTGNKFLNLTYMCYTYMYTYEEPASCIQMRNNMTFIARVAGSE